MLLSICAAFRCRQLFNHFQSALIFRIKQQYFFQLHFSFLGSNFALDTSEEGFTMFGKYLAAGDTVAVPLFVPVFYAGRAIARIDRLLAPRIAYRYLLLTGSIAPEHGPWHPRQGEAVPCIPASWDGRRRRDGRHV